MDEIRLAKEQALEKKYTDVLSHTSLQTVLNGFQVDSRSVNAAITAYCKSEKAEIPDNFCDAEIFANDVYEHWNEEKPGFHADRQYEKVLEGIKRYIAYKHIWKEKVNNNSAVSPMLQLQASSMLTVKSALGAAVISAHSHTKLDPRLRPGELAEAMVLSFQVFLPIIHKLQIEGKLNEPKVKRIAEIIHQHIESEEFKQISAATEKQEAA